MGKFYPLVNPTVSRQICLQADLRGGTCPELGLTMFQERPSGAYRIQENF